MAAVTFGTTTWPVKIWDDRTAFIGYFNPENIPEIWENKALVDLDAPTGENLSVDEGQITLMWTLTACSSPADTGAAEYFEKFKRALRSWSENDDYLNFASYAGSGDYNVATWSDSDYDAVETVTVKIRRVAITNTLLSRWTFNVTLKRTN